jgi:hypothetical protein
MWKTIYGHGRIGFIDEPPVVVNHAAQMGAIYRCAFFRSSKMYGFDFHLTGLMISIGNFDS